MLSRKIVLLSLKMTPQTKDSIYEGPLSVIKTGKGFFNFEDGESLFIAPEYLGGAFNGDTVKVQEIPKSAQGRNGKVIGIVQRARTMFVGTLYNDAQTGKVMLAPDNKRMYVPFYVNGDNLPVGNKVVVRLTHWTDKENFPSSELEEIIGKAGVHETEMRALLLSQGFQSEFPQSVQEDARSLEENGQQMLEDEIKNNPARKDFRDTTTFTIDPFDAKDFDDALSLKTLPNGNYEIGIHIADVSFFVRPGSAIDTEAKKRATSVYLVDRTVPMLPHVLSTNLCSLNEGVDRLSMSAVFEIDPQANIVSEWFGPTTIHSNKRFTYEEAQAVLNNQSGPFLDELNTLSRLAQILRAKRTQNGALSFDTPEVKIILDDTGKPIEIKLKVRQETNMLIEDFMLLANVAVAKRLSDTVHKRGLKYGSIYRVHDDPDPERIEALSQFLKVLGYNLPHVSGKVKGRDINALLKQVEGKPEEYLVKTATLRSMSKAVYTINNSGHYGLAFDYYTHFTSPIRRYPDLLIHRLIRHTEGKEPIDEKDWSDYARMATHSTDREINASEAERDSIKLKQVEFLQDKIGQEFDAVISGVTERGLFVEEQTTRADGMIRIKDLGNDFYTYDEKRYRLVGARTQKEYALGNPIRVKLVGTRTFDREIDFVPVEAA
jgi:ribonuclease R